MPQLLEGPAFYSYDLKVETKLNIDELIYTLSPDDLPLLPKMAARVAKTEAIPLAEQALDPRVLEWMAAKLPKPLGKLARAILRGV
jgi:hypothetical protein